LLCTPFGEVTFMSFFFGKFLSLDEKKDSLQFIQRIFVKKSAKGVRF
jgi:hypothetical protein